MVSSSSLDYFYCVCGVRVCVRVRACVRACACMCIWVSVLARVRMCVGSSNDRYYIASSPTYTEVSSAETLPFDIISDHPLFGGLLTYNKLRYIICMDIFFSGTSEE